ncbi:MAG: methyltransferase domain-containing protein [Halioglobus sp.]|nr:methyltransferase domain-containing protein [Halioglobus sp.]
MLAPAMENTDKESPRQRDVQRRFDRVADDPAAGEFVFATCRENLLERLLPMRVEAKRILILGSGNGTAWRELRKRFPGSRLICLDLSRRILKSGLRPFSFFSRTSLLQANAEAIPLRDGSVDVVVANLLLPWIANPPRLLQEVSRVLQKDGLFAFSSLGPDSLRELRDAFAADDFPHVREFADMHNVGDALIRAGFRDPVLDIDYLRFDYEDTRSLYRDLSATGARNSLAGRRRSLTGKQRFRRVEDALRRQFHKQGLRLTLEFVYGHAWGGGPRRQTGEFSFRVDDLRGQRRNR